MSTSANLRDQEEISVCFLCEQPAVGNGPYSHKQLCQQHFSVDVTDALKLKDEVAKELATYLHGGAGVAAADEAELLTATQGMQNQLQEIEERFQLIQQQLDAFRTRVIVNYEDPLKAMLLCQRDLKDVSSYMQEVDVASAAKDLAEVVQLAESMQSSIPDLNGDFERARQLRMRLDADNAERELQLRRLQQLEQLVGCVAAGKTAIADSKDVTIVARPDTKGVGTMVNVLDYAREVKLDGPARWLAVCTDTSGFFGDPSGRVVALQAALEGYTALPEPCILAKVTKKHLLVLSVDGSKRFRCHCEIDWDKSIWGLHCDLGKLFLAQEDSVTVADLSGRRLSQIQIYDFGYIGGICGNASSLFVSSRNKIAWLNKRTSQIEKVITLTQIPNADMRSLVAYNDFIIATDSVNSRVHRIHLDTHDLVSYPDHQLTGLAQFAYPLGVAVDSRGRLFVSEHMGHSVRVLSVEYGSLLLTLGEPGERGSGIGKFNCPWGLEVLRSQPDFREQLLLTDCCNSRLLVLQLD